jgi:hypothetical protein
MWARSQIPELTPEPPGCPRDLHHGLLTSPPGVRGRARPGRTAMAGTPPAAGATALRRCGHRGAGQRRRWSGQVPPGFACPVPGHRQLVASAELFEAPGDEILYPCEVFLIGGLGAQPQRARDGLQGALAPVQDEWTRKRQTIRRAACRGPPPPSWVRGRWRRCLPIWLACRQSRARYRPGASGWTWASAVYRVAHPGRRADSSERSRKPAAGGRVRD